jgi:transposase
VRVLNPSTSLTKVQISPELDQLELLLEQIKAVEAEQDALLAAHQAAGRAPSGDVARHRWRRAEVRYRPLVGRSVPTFDNRRQVPMRAWHGHLAKADRSIARACI